MIKISKFGDITRFDLSRTIARRGRYWTTAYLVDGLMVDTGCTHTADELLAALDDHQVNKIINTHSHEDHFGANSVLSHCFPALKIYSHPGAARVMSNPRRYQPLHLYRRVVWGWPGACIANPVKPDEMIETDNYSFQIIYTPGHSPDHLCLYETSQGWLFTGDLYIGGKDRALRSGCDIWGIINSLKLVAGLEVESMFPGSARVREKPKSDLVNKIEYYEQVGERVMDLHEMGSSVNQIRKELFGGPMPIELITLGHFSRRRLVLSYLRRNQEE